MAKAKRTSTYSEKLKDPRWQRLRLQILEREEWTCQGCGATDKPLNVHHGYYQYSKQPWEYDEWSLHVYCDECHKRADKLRSITNRMMSCLSLAEHIHTANMLDVVCSFFHEHPEQAAEVIVYLTVFIELQFKAVQKSGKIRAVNETDSEHLYMRMLEILAGEPTIA